MQRQVALNEAVNMKLILFLLSSIAIPIASIAMQCVGPCFTDADLSTLLRRGGKGVIYAVSEHMPLSVRGLNDIKCAAEALGLELVVVVDPDSDPLVIGYMASRLGFRPQRLRRLASAELMRRNLTIHYPSIQAYANGRFVGVILPGYLSTEAYELALNGMMSSK